MSSNLFIIKYGVAYVYPFELDDSATAFSSDKQKYAQ